jgi:hypothetical protein
MSKSITAFLLLFIQLFSLSHSPPPIQGRCEKKSVFKNTRHIAEAHDPDIINSIIEGEKT